MKKRKILLSAIFVFWSLFVVLGYFFQINKIDGNKIGGVGFVKALNYQVSVRESHSYYFSAIKENFTNRGNYITPILSIILLIICIYALAVVYKKHFDGDSFKFKLSPLLYVLFSIIFFLFCYYLWLIFFKQFGYTNLGFGFPVNFFKSIAEVLLICFTTLSFGKKVKNLLYKEAEMDHLKEIIFSFGFGVIALVLFLFILGAVGLLIKLYVFLLSIILLTLSHKEIVFWLKYLITPSRFELRLFDPSIILFLIFLIFLSFNFLNVLRPIPMGHDELEAYMNASNLLAQKGHLLNGNSFYPWQLYVSVPLILFNSIASASILSSFSGVLVFLGIFYLGRLYCQKRDIDEKKRTYYPMLIAVLFYTLPAVTFHLSKDIKLDLAAMFFAILAFVAFWDWKSSGSNLQRGKNQYLIVMSLLLGFAFAIKATLILFAFVIFILAAYEIWKKKIALKKSVLMILTCAILFLTPLLPFMIKNNIEVIQAEKRLTTSTLLSGISNSPEIKLTKTEEQYKSDHKNLFSSSGNAELFRYANYKNGVGKYLELPFIETFNFGPVGQYVDIGFIFLLMLPIIFFQYRSIVRSKGKGIDIFKGVVLCGAVYWLAWAAFAQGIIWYGFPGFIFLLLVLIEILNGQKTKTVTVIINLALFVWLVFNLFYATSFLPEYNVAVKSDSLAYAENKIDQKKYYENLVPRFAPITEMLNKEIDDNKEDPPKIYLVGKYIKYFINRNDELVSADDGLVQYSILRDGKTDFQLIDRLRDCGFDYIIVARKDVSFFGDDQKFFEDKMADLVEVAKNHPSQIRVLLDDETNGVFFAKIL